jgi:hypothetical protein
LRKLKAENNVELINFAMETVKMKEIVKYLETVIVKKGGKEKLSY